MSLAQGNGLRRLKCDKWKEIRAILITNNDLNKGSYIQLSSLVDILFFEHFQPLFKHYIPSEHHMNKRRFQSGEVSLQAQTDEDIWIFGYGSLVWKADFPHIDKKYGYIEGYQRRFYQYSIDHRGTSENPGRVVTLIPTTEPDRRVYGVAYRICARQTKTVLAQLDYREKNGYERRTVEFTDFKTHEKFDIVMYIATCENESYAGGNENDLKSIALQIYKSAGPSGTNEEYLFNLADSMRHFFPGVRDDHLFKLEEMVHQQEHIYVILKDMIKDEIRTILMTDPTERAIDDFRKLKEDCKTDGFLEEWYRLGTPKTKSGLPSV